MGEEKQFVPASPVKACEQLKPSGHMVGRDRQGSVNLERRDGFGEGGVGAKKGRETLQKLKS